MITTTWATRHAVARAHGCDLTVLWRGPDTRAWIVAMASTQVDSGVTRSSERAQSAALEAARRHALGGGQIQLDMF
ncbi:hypothetical protein [Azospirillum sp. SYSU D00513]|uniref:hypothetical protein n=1 Tax=Azospirillum sp. SYSU D00513 TaxID=2812561 RepID=UPI001A95E21C|nr:hypothetical protein [Azospirillum sp. SYSU D00513]